MSTAANPDEPGKKTDWSATQYLKYTSQRTRAVHDLVAQVAPHLAPSPSSSSPIPKEPLIYDLGCGPGNSTQVLHAAFPGARIVGVDSSPDMLSRARSTLPMLEFVQGDVGTFAPTPLPASAAAAAAAPGGGDAGGRPETGAETGPDGPHLLFSNAVFHWLRARTRIPTLARLLSGLPPGGVLAIQVPDNYAERSHALMRETAVMPDRPWSAYFASAGIGDVGDEARPDLDPIPPPGAFHDALAPLAASVDVWRTTYCHVLDDARAIVEWVRGTGLQPFLHRIGDDGAARDAFLGEYERRVADAYGTLADGRVLLEYPRLFVVAVRK